MARTDDQQPHRPPLRQRHPSRDFVEGLLGALVLFLLIHQFIFEVFRIPTGSMAPTLLGEHRDLQCPNCGLRFPLDANMGLGIDALCPNCKYRFTRSELQKAHCACFPSWPASVFGGGDNRVIVDKFMWDYPDDALARLFYRSGLRRALVPPKRWEVVVFRCPVADIQCLEPACRTFARGVRIDEGEVKCPACGSTNVQYERKNFIKRLVGLPGEQLEIRHGNIYVNGKLEPRPREVQEAQWQFVYDSAHVPKRETAFAPAAWKQEEGTVKLEGAVLRLTPGAGGIAEAQYGREINDVSTYSGYDGSKEPYRLGEIKWDVDVTLDKPGMLRLEMDEDELHYAGAVRFGAPAGKATTFVSVAGHDAKQVPSDFAAETGRPHRVTFSNSSGRLELAVDGKMVLAVPHAMPERAQARSSAASIRVDSATAQCSRVRLYRNIYYRPPERNLSYAVDGSGRAVMSPDSFITTEGYRIPEGQYVMMGDNQPNSWDSRYWGTVPTRYLMGHALIAWWPVEILHAIY